MKGTSDEEPLGSQHIYTAFDKTNFGQKITSFGLKLPLHRLVYLNLERRRRSWLLQLIVYSIRINFLQLVIIESSHDGQSKQDILLNSPNQLAIYMQLLGNHSVLDKTLLNSSVYRCLRSSQDNDLKISCPLFIFSIYTLKKCMVLTKMLHHRKIHSS